MFYVVPNKQDVSRLFMLIHFMLIPQHLNGYHWFTFSIVDWDLRKTMSSRIPETSKVLEINHKAMETPGVLATLKLLQIPAQFIVSSSTRDQRKQHSMVRLLYILSHIIYCVVIGNSDICNVVHSGLFLANFKVEGPYEELNRSPYSEVHVML